MKHINRRAFLQQVASTAHLPFVSSWVMQNMHINTRPIRGTPAVHLPVVGLGTWQTFDIGASEEGRVPLKEVLKVLSDHGGTVIDSSPMYGRSEEVVGDLSTEIGLNERFFIATKVWTSGKDQGIRQMNKSIGLLGRDRIELMQVHNLVDWQTHLKTLRDWKEQGRIKYIGMTHYTESAYPLLEQIITAEEIDFLQVNYSVASRKAEHRLFPLCLDRQVAVLVNQPFESGRLFDRVRGKVLPSGAQDFDCHSWGQYFLKFILSHAAVTCVIPGTSKPHHMLDNLGAGLGRLPDEKQRQEMVRVVQGKER